MVLLDVFLWGAGNLKSNWSPDVDFGGAVKAGGLKPFLGFRALGFRV